MTDNEIIRALECCTNTHLYTCDDCPFCKQCGSDEDVLKYALDLINRQQAEVESDKAKKEICAEVIDRQDKEIERLQGILLAFMDEVARWEGKHGLDVSELSLIPICDEGRDIIDHYRKQAIEQFAEKLKENTIDVDVSYGYGREHYTEAVAVIEIDNLVKEMVGDSNAEN